jgi:hypothetical protein
VIQKTSANWHPLIYICLCIGIAGWYGHASVPGPLPKVLADFPWTQPNIIRIPFRLSGALITVQAKVDTVEGTFIFDTGASNLLLNQRYFKSSGFASEAGGVTGKVKVKGKIKTDSVILDELERRSITADLMDMTHIERAKKIRVVGIIGYSVFEGYEILFDYSASVLTLVRHNEKGVLFENIPDWEYEPIGHFPLLVKDHIAMLSIQFGRKKKVFGLDSGAEQNLLDLVVGKAFLKNNFTVLKRVKLNGTGSNSVEVMTGNLANGRLDTFQFKPMATILTNMQDINTVYQTNLEGILGYEFLSQTPMSINYKKRRITFYRPASLKP